jgi:hypothetical protein
MLDWPARYGGEKAQALMVDVFQVAMSAPRVAQMSSDMHKIKADVYVVYERVA